MTYKTNIIGNKYIRNIEWEINKKAHRNVRFFILVYKFVVR